LQEGLFADISLQFARGAVCRYQFVVCKRGLFANYSGLWFGQQLHPIWWLSLPTVLCQLQSLFIHAAVARFPRKAFANCKLQTAFS
jgi:hypothetical protein